MISSITTKPVPFIIERERTIPAAEQTVFWIKPKTQEDTNESASNYAKAAVTNRRKGRNDLDPKAMQQADIAEWMNIVIRIENFLCIPGAPGGAYDHFSVKSAADPTKYKTTTDGIVVTDTDVDVDRRMIFISMSPKDSEEILAAAVDFNELKAGERNF